MTRVASIRLDAMHKLTHRLATTFGTVVVEDLRSSGPRFCGRTTTGTVDIF